jgi:aryl-alcohol dehydrogenase-like predicted oxidoreductase
MWVLTKRHLTSTITGATRAEQLEENLKAGEALLSPETVRLVEELFPPSAED